MQHKGINEMFQNWKTAACSSKTYIAWLGHFLELRDASIFEDSKMKKQALEISTFSFE